MNQFKYLIFFTLYCILLKYECKSVAAYVILITASAVFLAKYADMQSKIIRMGIFLKKSLTEQRERFISSLSHDLRIPVLAQLRALELINKGMLGELTSEQKDIFLQTEDATRCILNLMSMMISTYRLENSSEELNYRHFNLYELVSSCFEELRREAAEKNLTYEYECNNKNLCISADREEFKKVLTNLIILSSRYSKYGEKLSVRANIFNNKLRISVSSGSELPSYVNINSDSPFTSVGESIRMHFCKKIIEIHRGQILKQNSKDFFEFEVPLAAV